MPSRLMPLFAALALAACTVERAPVATLPLASADGRIEWRGAMPCADCDGIETVLVLERAGDDRRYELVETFHATDGGARFAEVGDWRMQDAVVDLAGDEGSRRHYAVLDNGALQPRDTAGRAFDAAGADVLMPVEASLR
jgi:copper homeostasis protein (lipoprotein)